jgi:hypothetical protein
LEPRGFTSCSMDTSHVRSMASHAYVLQAPETRVLRRSVRPCPRRPVGVPSDKPRSAFAGSNRSDHSWRNPVAAFSVCPAVTPSAIGTV